MFRKWSLQSVVLLTHFLMCRIRPVSLINYYVNDCIISRTDEDRWTVCSYPASLSLKYLLFSALRQLTEAAALLCDPGLDKRLRKWMHVLENSVAQWLALSPHSKNNVLGLHALFLPPGSPASCYSPMTCMLG